MNTKQWLLISQLKPLSLGKNDFKRIRSMTKFKVVRYWDTYPDGVVATCDTEEEAEKICKEYLKKRKSMYDYLVRKENE